MVLVLGWLLAWPALAQDPHPFNVHDLLAMERISDLQVSPDGKTVAYVQRSTDLEANRGRTDLWLVGADGTGSRRLTSHPASDTTPRWAPDGESIFFLSSRSGSTQVWQIPVKGGEASPVTELSLDVQSLDVSPDGRRLALALEVFPGKSPEETKKALDDKEKGKTTGRVYESLFIRHWDTWKDGRRLHVFAYTLSDKTMVDVMKDMDADCPTKPFGGPEDHVFSPDGESLVFVARDVGRAEAWSTDFDLWQAPVDGKTTPTCLTGKNEAWDTHPVFSPDGSQLAYLAMKRPGFESDRFRIVVRSLKDGKEKVLTESWDRSPGSIGWARDGRALLATADNLGQGSLFAIDADTGSVTTLVQQGTVRGFAQTGDRLLFAMDHLRSPVEIHSCDLLGSDVRRVTHVNDERVAATLLGEPEQFTFKGWNGETVHCYVVKPANFDPSRKHPVAFLIHGGPQGSFGNDFHYRWNPQTYAGAGYAAVMVDFHGSTGYGQTFTDSISGDWGGKPLEDLQKGLAAALARYPWMDGERVCALGASFGGYMINWIAGNWPDRFRCLVNHDGNIDERMAYYDTEELWFPEWERGGTPWDVPDSYKKHNPIDHVGKWKTPMLVIHGALDYRVVDTQGISTFTALQRRGIPSKLLYFPDENHWVLKPHNSIQWHETVIDWIDRWTKGETPGGS
jgi:dipeptidyl aminopeptidase/acylaminoacyl peptidase